jgi:quinol monooxygenase YgiN
MKYSFFIFLFSILTINSGCNDANQKDHGVDNENMIVRISEIEIDSAYLEQYKTILKEEAAQSVKLEPEVIAIHPMIQKENPAVFRILEIYASKEAYQSHLKTPHFLKYKSSTLNMVKSLKLVDMTPLDSATMPAIFRKMQE